MKKSEEYIICSAIHFDDNVVYDHQPINIESGYVICGRRHHNCLTTLKILGGNRDNQTQGFLTSHDRFLDRYESAKLVGKEGRLYSEDLY